MDETKVNEALLRAAEREGPEAVDEVTPVLEAYRTKLERMLRLRMDHRVVGRVGVSDIMQDTYLEVARRLPDYLTEWSPPAPPSGDANPTGTDPTEVPPGDGRTVRSPMPFYLWVRFIAGQALRQTHRRHLGTIARDAGRDVPLFGKGRNGVPEATSMMFASALVESGLSPSGFAVREEQREALTDALTELAPEDREVLFLRHFEQLSNKEIAVALGLSPGGASLRHLRALGRLQKALAKFGTTFDPGRDGFPGDSGPSARS